MGSWGVWSSSIRKPLPSVKRAKGLWGPIYVFEKKNSLLGSTPILLSPTLVKFPFIVFLSGLHDPEHCHRCLVKMLTSGPPSASQSPWVLFILIPVQKPGEKEHFLCARREVGEFNGTVMKIEPVVGSEGQSPLPRGAYLLSGGRRTGHCWQDFWALQGAWLGPIRSFLLDLEVLVNPAPGERLIIRLSYLPGRPQIFNWSQRKPPLMLKGRAFKFPGDSMQWSLLGLTGRHEQRNERDVGEQLGGSFYWLYRYLISVLYTWN